MVSEKLGAAFIEVGVDTGGLTTGLAGAKAQVTSFGASVSSAFSGLAASINPATIAIAGATAGIMAVGAAFAGSVRAAAQWQTLMVDVQKVTDTTAAGFASLSKDLLAIRGETGASMESIAGAAAGAGRMGIDPTEIADYTSTILKMSSAWGMSADAASESIGKIGSVVKPAEMTWTEFGNRMGSTINDLADSMATSEESIVTGMKKVSAQMAMLKPSPDQLSAWAALIGQLQAFGMTAETSGESLKDALNYMMRDDKSGISSMLDMDATEFQEAIREDAIGTIQELAVAISELPIEEQGQALQKFGATGGQMMGMLVGKVDPVTKEVEGLNAALETGASAWENASSLNEAYAKSQETLNAQIDIFRGKISTAAVSIGTVLLPYLTQMMEAVNDITQALIDLGTRGWQWLTGGAEGENVAERAAGKVRSWADSQGWLSGYLADYDAAKARDAGVDLGQDLTKGVAEGTEGVGPAIEGNLENVDGEGAGKEAGKSYSEAFMEEFVKGNERAWEIGIDHLATAGMTRPGRASWKDAGYTSGTEWGDGFELALKRERFSSSVKDFNTYLIGTKEYSFNLTDLRKEMISKGVIDVVSHEIYAAQQAIDKYEAETGIKLDIPMSVIMEWVGEDPVAIAEQKLKEAQEGISPYEIWGTPQHWADYSAKYWGEIEDLTILELYNLEDHLRSEGAAGWERAWETILDPDATEAQITGALGVLSPVLEEMGYENGDSYLLGLRERVAESGAELADSIVDSGKYQEYKIEELGETWGNALKDSMIKVQEQETLLGIVDALEDAGYEGSAALRQAILDEDWEGLGALIGDRTGGAMEKTLFGRELRMKDIPALSDLIADPDKLKQTVQNWDQWAENTYQPALQNHIDEASAKWESGYYSQSELNKDYFRDLMTNALQYSDWYEGWQLGLLGAYARGDVGLQEFFDLWENGGKAIEGAAAAIDEERQNLAGLTAEADCACEAMSEFGMAQEAMSDQLFNRSYIGPTSGYAAFLEEERARGAFHPEAQQLSMVYKVEADTEAAEKSVEDLKTDIDQSEAAPQIDAITQPAYDAVDSFLGWVDSIYASVYVDAYGPGTEYAGGGGYLESLSPGITSSPGWGTPEWLPQLAEGGIVTGPTIAHLAENNRPEAIIPLDQITKIIGGGGGNTYNIRVNGGNAEEIARAIREAIEDYDRTRTREGAHA